MRESGWTNTTLQPEWSLVLEYPLSSGTDLDWDWLAHNERLLYFQVVYMKGNQPEKLVARHFDEDKDEITAPQSGVYQVIWMNDAVFDASFSWKTREGYSEKLYPPSEGPGCLALLASVAC